MVRARSPSDFFVDKVSPRDAESHVAPLYVVRVSEFDGFRSSLPTAAQAWLKQTQFKARAGAVAHLPAEKEGASLALVVVERPELPWDYGWLPTRLPTATYRVASEPEAPTATALALGFALGSYRFDRYKKSPAETSKLVWPQHADRALVVARSAGIFLARDLVNTPASDLGPDELKHAAKQVAKEHGAKFSAIEGKALLDQNYPMIHAVGRASSRAPLLVDFTWGKAKHPLLTLVGKGVCFDTGGLDLKPAAFMKLMKKDMGGAALVLGLAHVIMSRQLPVRLRVLIPAVENSVSGDAMRPLDVLTSRKGLTVEVGDTDAEGRLILADALTEADSEKPDLIIDAATLTGAARVALGTQMPAVFATKSATWGELETAAADVDEPLWRLPLHRGYRSRIDSNVADLSNIGTDSYAGAITAALFLEEFVTAGRDWLHVDTMGYNLESRPGRPAGGEALGLLALDEFLVRRYASRTADVASSSDAAAAASSAVASPSDVTEARRAKSTTASGKSARSSAKKPTGKKTGKSAPPQKSTGASRAKR